MNIINAARLVLKDGIHLIRRREDGPDGAEYDAKPAFNGKKKGWIYLDAYSASALVGVYDALSDPEKKKKFAHASVERALDFAWKVMK